jgi:hypothetical protein
LSFGGHLGLRLNRSVRLRFRGDAGLRLGSYTGRGLRGFCRRVLYRTMGRGRYLLLLHHGKISFEADASSTAVRRVYTCPSNSCT